MMTKPRKSRVIALALAAAATGLAGLAPVPAFAQFRQEITNDMSRCRGDVPAIRVNVTGIKEARGNMRVQLYRGIKPDWLVSGRWISRIEVPARAGNMSFCLPVPLPGTYAVAVRHDLNGNGSTDIFSDGGGMSNNPSVNVFNLGRPSYKRVAFEVGKGVETINIQMRYM